MIVSRKCPVCGHQQAEYRFPVAKGELVRCLKCDLVHYTPLPTADELKAFYDQAGYRETYQDGPMTDQAFVLDRYRELRAVLHASQPALLRREGRKLLDIGCGHADLLRVAKADGWQVTGTEISARAVEQAPADLRAGILVGSIESVQLPAASFDLITMYHLIEHLPDPVGALLKLNGLLRPGGVLFIETPNMAGLAARLRGRKWGRIVPPEHLCYFRPRSIEYALRLAGFEQIRSFSRSPPVIKATEGYPALVRFLVRVVYSLAPMFGLGANLQAVAIRASTP